jgi:hypothetical protein
MSATEPSTFELAKACKWKIGKLEAKNTKQGRFYFVELNGVMMKASEARKLCLAHLQTL